MVKLHWTDRSVYRHGCMDVIGICNGLVENIVSIYILMYVHLYPYIDLIKGCVIILTSFDMVNFSL